MWRARLLALAALAGCHIAFPIEPYDGDAALGTPPRVFSSPGPAWVMYGGYPKAFSITLAADLPGTVIYYTTDGSMPDPASPATTSSTTPVGGITISATTMVKYFGDHNGARSQVA